jgi:tetratricopeptide (TPR) repeat protein
MRRVATALALLAATAWAGPKKSPWIEVKTPHFRVYCDGGRSAARDVALQMERMREVFRQAFPGLRIDPPSPIAVLAVRNAREMREVEPAAYLGRGKLTLGGYFQRTPGRDLVLLRLSAPYDSHPYRIIYHEYTHLVTSRGKVPLPVWLSEGLAEFYESTVIRGDDVALGQPERFNLELLRRQPLIPLPTLFAVDQSSPYYHEQDKGSIFYAESWALTHYFMLRRPQRNSRDLARYLVLLRQGQDPVTAAAHAFGDLAALQKRLHGYIHQLSYHYLHERLKITVDPKYFTVAPLPLPEADAVRGEYLAWNGRYAAAASMLHAVLLQDPGNARALASLGWIAYRQHRYPAAAQRFRQAVARAPGDFFDQYYAGMLLLRQLPLSPAQTARAAANLQAAIRLNPRFAPAYDDLAVLYADSHRHLNQADRLELQAITLDPANFDYRINTAAILIDAGRAQDAIAVLKAALPRAGTAEQRRQCEQRIAQARQFLKREAAEQRAEAAEKAYLARNESSPGLPSGTGATEAPAAAGPPSLSSRSSAPRQTYTGTITSVHCNADPKASVFSMQLALASGSTIVLLHTPNYLRVAFEAANFTPRGVLDPCSAIQGMKATVTTMAGQITTVVLSK